MRQVMLTDVSQRPTHPIFDLRDLSSSAYQPEFSGDTVTVGDARVAVTEKSIQIEGEAVTSEGKALTLYQYQALVAAVWTVSIAATRCRGFRNLRHPYRILLWNSPQLHPQ